MSVKDKKDKAGPRKLLGMDGGGIRGVMTLEVLENIESELQKKLGRGDDFVLADYFDYVGGTSTGAVIATCGAVFGFRTRTDICAWPVRPLEQRPGTGVCVWWPAPWAWTGSWPTPSTTSSGTPS